MISSKDLYKEITVIEKSIQGDMSEDQYRKHLLKSNVLILKLLQNDRANTVQIMRKMGIEPIEAKEKDETQASGN